MLGELEARLSHSAEKEAGREETQTLTHSFGAIHSLASSLSLTTERESENQSERGRVREHENERAGEKV